MSAAVERRRMVGGAFLRPLVRLLRLPNCLTASGDVLAGYLMVAPGEQWRFGGLAVLMAASAVLYGAGCVLNDRCDYDADCRWRPERPLPAGELTLATADRLTAGLLLLALLAALSQGGQTLLVGAALAGLVIVYDVAAKQHPLAGPLAMGGCRALNLTWGMTLVPVSQWGWLPVGLAGVTVAYVFSLTTFSRQEHLGGRSTLWQGSSGWLLVMICLGLLLAGGRLRGVAAFWYLALLLLTGIPQGRALREPQPARIKKAVGFLVMGIVLLDGLYVAGLQGGGRSLPLVVVFILATGAARRIMVS